MSEQVVEAQSLPAPRRRRQGNRELYATVAFYYPQYKLEDVQAMPYKDVKLLLRVAEKINADKYITLTQIVAAPHTEKGKGIKTLVNHFRKISEQ